MGGTLQREANDLKTLTNLSSSPLLTKLEFRDLRNLGIFASTAVTGCKAPADGNA